MLPTNTALAQTSADAPQVSVVVVTYNSSPTLEATLRAAVAQQGVSFEIIVQDNASRDDSLAIARRFEPQGVKVIACLQNRGFAGGNNDAVAQSRGELVVLLNPDAVLPPDGLRQIHQAFVRRAEMGILGAKLVDPDGVTLQQCGGQIDLSAHCRLYGRGEKDQGQWDQAREVDFVIGALLGIRRSDWDRLGGFDEFFNPAFYEDADLCTRCRRQLGKRVMYWPLRVIHHEKASVNHTSSSFWWMHVKGRVWFLLKNLPFWKLVLLAFPAELAWFFQRAFPCSRWLVVKVYWIVFKRFIVRRCLRLKPIQ